MSKPNPNPLLNVVPFSRNANPAGFLAPEIKVDDKLPTEPPDFMGLSVIERRIFNYIIGGMLKGLHKETDALEVARLAQAMAKALRLQKEIAINGEIYTKQDIIGNTTYSRNPQLFELATTNNLINCLMKNLGLCAITRRGLIPHNRRVTADVNRWGT